MIRLEPGLCLFQWQFVSYNFSRECSSINIETNVPMKESLEKRDLSARTKAFAGRFAGYDVESVAAIL